jgi:hypothetical protein
VYEQVAGHAQADVARPPNIQRGRGESRRNGGVGLAAAAAPRRRACRRVSARGPKTAGRATLEPDAGRGRRPGKGSIRSDR